jgi:predicted amidohydrolase
VDAFLVPSAFLKKTGQAHWHVLLRARAIENQSFVIAPAQAGLHSSPRGRRESFGSSMIVNPWGEIIAEAEGDQPQVIRAKLDKKHIEKVRSQIPMEAHRKPPYTYANILDLKIK